MEQLTEESMDVNSAVNLANSVDKIIKLGRRDDERAHVREDELHLMLIDKFCPEWAKEEINRLTNAAFSRWYA